MLNDANKKITAKINSIKPDDWTIYLDEKAKKYMNFSSIF